MEPKKRQIQSAEVRRAARIRKREKGLQALKTTVLPDGTAVMDTKALTDVVMASAERQARKANVNPFTALQAELVAATTRRDPLTGVLAKPKQLRKGVPKTPEAAARKAAGWSNLNAHRWRTMLGQPGVARARTCARVLSSGRTCGRMAVRHSPWCVAHGGRSAKEKAMALKYADYKPEARRVAAKIIYRLLAASRIDHELIRTEGPFARALNLAVKGVSRDDPRFAHMGPEHRRQFHEACCLLVLAYLAAWEDIRVHRKVDKWGNCRMAAQKMGLFSEY